MKKWQAFLMSTCVVLLDQLSKYWVVKHYAAYQSVKIMPMFNLTLAYNSGSAFSFLSQAGDWHRWFFTGFSALMSVALIIWMIRLPARATLQLVSVSLILAGAVGNLIDRLAIGYVVDFIDVYYEAHHWPVFNIADSAICLGAVLLAYSTFTSRDITLTK
ncbi:MAG: signal peptidase II [Legionellaceae bacterium]|nr:signal peptidase II [Legionellaceae bacterium]